MGVVAEAKKAEAKDPPFSSTGQERVFSFFDQEP